MNPLPALALALLLELPAAAQTLPPDHFKPAPPGPPEPPLVNRVPAARPPVTSREGRVATLRALDRMTGVLTEFTLEVGAVRAYERLEIRLGTCRVPGEGEPPDAYAWLEIRDLRLTEPSFRGWMFASSPALSALDHPRYDVWVVSCSTSSAEASRDRAQN